MSALLAERVLSSAGACVRQGRAVINSQVPHTRTQKGTEITLLKYPETNHLEHR